MVVIAGPPCSGKSTRAATLGLPILDWDELYAETSGLPIHQRSTDPRIADAVEAAFQAELASAARIDIVAIRAAPRRWHRGMLRSRFGARVTVLEVPVDECVRRLRASDRPRSVWPATEASIVAWWRDYERSPRDLVRNWDSEEVNLPENNQAVLTETRQASIALEVTR